MQSTTRKRKATTPVDTATSDVVAVQGPSAKRSATTFTGTTPELPLELVCRVLAWVSVADLVRGQRVCRQWRDIIAPSPPPPSSSPSSSSPSSSSSSSSSSFALSSDLWRRAYFNTWPLPACTAPPPPPTSDHRRPELTSLASKAARRDVDRRVKLEEEPSRDWRAIGLERLRLHAQDRRHAPADVAEAVAQLRVNMSRGVVDVLAALAPSIYYRRVHRRTVGVEGGGGGVGVGRLEDKEYAVDAVVYSATTGLPLHMSLSYTRREDPSDRVPIFDDDVCPSVFFYAGVEPCEAVVRVPEDVESAPTVEDEYEIFLWMMVNVVEYLVGRAAGSERVTHIEVQDFLRALLNTGDADWVVCPEFLEAGARLPHPFVRE